MAVTVTAGISGTIPPTSTLNVVIATQGLRANLRSGPGTNFEIVTKANPGQVFEVTGRSDNGAWYQVKLNTPAAGGKTQTAWVSREIVRQAGAGLAPVVATATDEKVLLTSDLSADWRVDWSCASQRCEIKQCGADVTAAINREPLNNFLPVEHKVTWDDECFSTDAWTFEVDEFTGQERSGEAKDNFLCSYWMGAKPGETNGVLPLKGGEGVAVHCSGPHSVEIEEGGGWTTIYEGNTCHDVNTGMLVYMNYIKRWLFTGDHEGRTYERAYFGDSEKLEQRLIESSAPLAYVKEK